jgi:5'-3' exoribonuclease 1
MTNATSPIRDFYPDDFKIDANGKRNPWEAIALIPFIEETRLLGAISKVNNEKLTENERARNSFGIALVVEYDESVQGTYPSPAPYFNDLTPALTSCITYAPPAEVLREDGYCPPPKLLKGVKMGIEGPPGFPTLKNLPHTCTLSYAGVSLFGMSSR